MRLAFLLAITAVFSIFRPIAIYSFRWRVAVYDVPPPAWRTLIIPGREIALKDSTAHGRRIREIVKMARQKYHREELQEMADDMTYSVNSALNLMVAMGAPRLLLEDDNDANQAV